MPPGERHGCLPRAREAGEEQRRGTAERTQEGREGGEPGWAGADGGQIRQGEGGDRHTRTRSPPEDTPTTQGESTRRRKDGANKGEGPQRQTTQGEAVDRGARVDEGSQGRQGEDEETGRNKESKTPKRQCHGGGGERAREDGQGLEEQGEGKDNRQGWAREVTRVRTTRRHTPTATTHPTADTTTEE